MVRYEASPYGVVRLATREHVLSVCVLVVGLLSLHEASPYGVVYLTTRGVLNVKASEGI